MPARVKTRLVPSGMKSVILQAGGEAILLATIAVEEEAKLYTPGQGRTPYEPTSLQTGKLIASIDARVVVRSSKPVGIVSGNTRYALRQEFRIVKSGRRKSYLRAALKTAKF